ncbi:hypothetical protein [Massilia sp. 9096]|uniref:hypothetical protein n=1 Tax=Massilia sp. 9096 TaxID=1500894 RepID=UPI0012DFF6F9|nr:hypothetical protein [Massilia sp. 9096]
MSASPAPHATSAANNNTQQTIIVLSGTSVAFPTSTIFSENVIDASKEAEISVKNVFARSFDSA